MSGKIHETDDAAIIPWIAMIDEGELLRIRGKADVTDPTLAHVENVTDGILDSITVFGMMYDRQIAIRIPIREADILQYFPGRAASQGSTGQHSFRNY